MPDWMKMLGPSGTRGIPDGMIVSKYRLTSEGLVLVSPNEEEVFDDERMERLKAAAKKRLDNIHL